MFNLLVCLGEIVSILPDTHARIKTHTHTQTQCGDVRRFNSKGFTKVLN